MEVAKIASNILESLRQYEVRDITSEIDLCQVSDASVSGGQRFNLPACYGNSSSDQVWVKWHEVFSVVGEG